MFRTAVCSLSAAALLCTSFVPNSFAQTTINGTSGNDRIIVNSNGTVTLNGQPYNPITSNPVTSNPLSSGITINTGIGSITIGGFAGITGSTINGISVKPTGLGTVINGTNGNDTIVVGPFGASVNGIPVNLGGSTTMQNTLTISPFGVLFNGLPVTGAPNLTSIAGSALNIGAMGLSMNGVSLGLNYTALYGNIGGMMSSGMGMTTPSMLSSLVTNLTSKSTTGLASTVTSGIVANLTGYQPGSLLSGSTGTTINGTPGNDVIIIGPNGQVTVNGQPVNTSAGSGIPTSVNTVNVSPGVTLLNQLINGQVSPQTFASTLAASGNLSQTQATQFTSSLIGNNGATTAALGALTNSVLSGQVSPATALALSSTGVLGNVSNIAGLTSLISNPTIMNSLTTALTTGGPAALNTQLGAILGMSATSQLSTSLLQNPALAQQLTQALSGVLGPQVTAMLGGLTGLLSSMMSSMTNTLAQTAATQALQQLAQQRLMQAVNLNNNVQCGGCGCCTCHIPIIQDHKNIRAHMTNQFELFRIWLVSTWYPDNIVPGLMLMTSQMTSAAMYQVFMFGALLDAKHQLETQRLFQQMTARAHKDYHPSEGMCEFGTATRSLATSERRSDLSQTAFAQHMLKRTLKSGDVLSVEGRLSDKKSRLDQFLKEYCDKNDNGKGENNQGGLETLCKNNVPAERRNRDIDYTNTMDVPLTLDVDFLTAANTNDEKDIFALSSNLYAHDVPEKINRTLLANDKGDLRTDAFPLYMDLRAVTAKRTVAQNAMAAQAAMKSKGAQEVAPFLKAFIRDLGLDETEVHKLIGTEPSYFAQMEVLTKKIYENPKFYADLYDKPSNVERKLAVMEALEIMQDRDIFDSLLRSEAILAVYLETMLNVEQDRVSADIREVVNEGQPVKPASGGATP